MTLTPPDLCLASTICREKWHISSKFFSIKRVIFQKLLLDPWGGCPFSTPQPL